MRTVYTLTALLAVTLYTTPLIANTSADGNCIIGGRLNAQDQLSRGFGGIELLNAQGARLHTIDKTQLETIKLVRVSKSALLSACNAGAALKVLDSAGDTKTAPAARLSVGSDPVKVEQAWLLPLKTGGNLIELRVSQNASRTVMR
jgi:hypothetical protein